MGDPLKLFAKLDVAEKMLSIGKYQKAYAILTELYLENPNSRIVEFSLARAEYLLGNTAEAKKMLLSLYAEGSTIKGICWHLAICCLRENNLIQAEEFYLEELSRNPQSEEARVLFAALLVDNKRYDDGLVILEEELAKNPFNHFALRIISRIYFERSEFQKLHDLKAAYLQTDATEVQKLLFLGELELMLKKTKQAEKLFLQALDLDPNNPKIIERIEVARYIRQHPVQKFIYDQSKTLNVDIERFNARTKKKVLFFTLFGQDFAISKNDLAHFLMYLTSLIVFAIALLFSLIKFGPSEVAPILYFYELPILLFSALLIWILATSRVKGNTSLQPNNAHNLVENGAKDEKALK